ncbi:Glycosyltransferase, catalytic subunit of cellulose synthase and poly-beta-1,6-N-acetylglucosamine synthase [Pedobacter westerhofensis]|uniref:Glycosyltransferase, catalytic subunit of cellulose synthase and poly-beta-1,6-N-acetylglucosamine synthase n=1 Tax=Pedobacter westerhofensis TaxID=425512 RepID=A0A521E6H1_9SPHI|nr:glycosyltransferase [Pedobacter westerhofensis]SMO79485.1 Glycosyltransferase, catalytic subunit of cellulose synthase and poly-beta-1,6-N-acetylglucosamine synthase [Pedobacter westerhofensis]
MLKSILIIFQVIIGYNLVLPFLLYIFYTLVKKSRFNRAELKEYDYGIIVTAYEQTALLPAVVSSLLQLNYSNYLIYVVADNCDISDLHFNDPRVILLKPEKVLASNTRSHLYAIANFRRAHEILTIIDSDNLTDPNYLNELNVYFDAGFEAVQGVRAAKNLNTTYACLDAARDIYYHFYDGEVLFQLGSSATLSGSGMAFTTVLYKACFDNLDITGAGFDKVLQAQILRMDKRIAFAKDAIVYDEKTADSGQLVNQRSRWINTWFKYFGYGFDILLRGIKKLNLNQFLFGIILLRPPLFIFILLSGLCCLVNIFIFPIYSLIWVIAFGLFILSFVISLKNHATDPRIYKSLVNIPKFIYFQLLSLVHAKQANKRSVATKHNINS